MAHKTKKIRPEKVGMEMLEKRVLYSADPMFGTLLDSSGELLEDKDEAAQRDVALLDAQLPTQTNSVTELIIVDVSHADLETLHTTLLETFASTNKQVVSINSESNALDQLSALLAQYSDLDAIHLLSHSSDGVLQLGGDTYTADAFNNNAETVSLWGNALNATGDLLLYGCNLSSTDAGTALASTLSTLMRADVASSDDITGHSSLGGDWDLEVEFGNLETDTLNDAAPLDDWVAKLDISTGLSGQWEFINNGLASVGSLDATEVNTPTYTQGLVGAAVDLSSTQPNPQHLIIADDPSINIQESGFTTALWIRPDIQQNSTILDKADSTGGYTINLLSNGRIQVQHIDNLGNTNSFISSEVVDIGQWNHVAFTYGDGTTTITVNGTATTSSTPFNSVQSSSSDLYIGQAVDGTDPYTGALDNLRIYLRELTLADIDELYNLDNTEEQLVNGGPFSLAIGERATLSNIDLLTIDSEQPDHTVTYTVQSNELGFNLLFEGVTLIIGDTFTQLDIDDGRIDVEHSIATPITSTIELQVDDGFGTPTTFGLTISALINEAPTDIVIAGGASSIDVLENVENDTVIGSLRGVDPERDALLADLLSNNPDLFYSADAEIFLQTGVGRIEWQEAYDTAANTVINGVYGHLAFPNTQIEQNFLYDTLLSESLNQTWLSATDNVVEGEWVIVQPGQADVLFYSSSGNSPAGFYTNWAPLEPNSTSQFEDYLEIYHLSGDWNDIGAFKANGNHFFVEFDAEELLNGTTAPSSVDTNLTYNLINQSIPGAFLIDNATGDVIVADTSLLVNSTNPVHTLTIEVTDSALNTFSKDIEVNILEFDEPSVHTHAASISIDSNTPFEITPPNTQNISLTDPDNDQTLTLTLGVSEGTISLATADNLTVSGTQGITDVNALEITGLISDLNSAIATLVYTPDNNYVGSDTLTIESVRALDHGDPLATVTNSELAITVNYVNQAPTDIVVNSSATDKIDIDENTANGTVVGTVQGVDVDRDNIIAGILAKNPDAVYSELADIFLQTGSTLTSWNEAYAISQTMSLNGVAGKLGMPHTAAEQAFFFDTIIDQNLGRTWISATDVTVEGVYVIVEPGQPDVQIADAAGNAVNGAFVTWREGEPNSHSADEDYIEIFDPVTGGWNDEINAGPGQGNSFFAEYSGEDILGTSLAAGVNQSLTYSITAQTSAGAFAIDDATGDISVTDSSLIDFEDNDTHQLTISVTDSEGLSYSEVVEVCLADVDEPATHVHNTTTTILENTDLIFDPNLIGSNAFGGIIIDEPDANQLITLELSVTNGTFSLSQNTNLTDNDGTGFTNTSSLKVTGLVGALNSALENATYTPNTDFVGLDTIKIQTTGGAGFFTSQLFQETSKIDVNVTNVNNAPTAVADEFDAIAGISTTLDVIANDFDSEADGFDITVVTQPEHGILTQNQDGTFNYAHDGSNTTSDSWTYFITDTHSAASDTVTVDISIEHVNFAPTAENDAYTVLEGSVTNLPVLSNDSDPTLADSLSISSTTRPNHGLVLVNGFTTDGAIAPQESIEYIHFGSESTTDTFDYTITDGNGGFSTATVILNITPVNDPPIALNSTASVIEGSSTNIIVLDNVSDAENDTLSVMVATQAMYGFATVNSDMSITYVHDGTENHTDTFEYWVGDGNGGTTVAVVDIDITPANDLPEARDDIISLSEGTAHTFNALTNDTDIDGTISFDSILTDPINGTVAINTDGTFTYTHNDSETISDSFIYQIIDSDGGLASATVNINVAPINDPPIAKADIATTLEGEAVNITVLSNDNDPNFDILTVSISNQPTNGEAKINPDKSISYVHDGSENHTDTFEYTIDDSKGGVASAIVTITVNAINDLPVAKADMISVAEGTGITFNALTNDTDIEGSVSLYEPQPILIQPSNGALTTNPNGTFNYLHNGSETLSDSFTYQIIDSDGAIASAKVSIIVDPINDPPVAETDLYTVDEGGSFIFDVTVNDTDSESGVSIVSIQQPINGIVTNNGNEVFTYTHNGSETTSDSFTYTIKDANGATTSGQAFITINPVNDAPIAKNDLLQLSEGASKSIDVLANDIDADNITLTPSVTTQPLNGTVALNNDNTFTYAHDGSETVTDSFEYTVFDSAAGSSTAKVDITIIPINDNGPIIANGPFIFTVLENAANDSTVGSILATDADANDELKFSLVDDANGRFQILSDGTIKVLDGKNIDHESYNNHTLTVQVTDSAGNSTTAPISVDVLDELEPITQLNSIGPFFIPEETPSNVVLGIIEAIATDDSGVINYTLQDDFDGLFSLEPLTGQLTLADTSVLDFESTNQYNLFVTATDATGTSLTETVEVSVTNINELPTITNTAPMLVYMENQLPLLVSDSATVSDVDNVQLDKIDITITNVESLEDQLFVNDTENITTSYDAAAGQLTLKGPATLAEFNAILQQVAYTNNSDNPNTEDRLLVLSVHESNNVVTTPLSTIQIVEVNDPPSGTALIIGTPEIGAQLVANTTQLQDADGIATFAYQWLRNDEPIAEATNSTYTIDENDVDSDLTVRVTLLDTNGRQEDSLSNTISVPATTEPETEPEAEPEAEPEPEAEAELEPELASALPAELNPIAIDLDNIASALTAFDNDIQGQAATGFTAVIDNSTTTQEQIAEMMAAQQQTQEEQLQQQAQTQSFSVPEEAQIEDAFVAVNSPNFDTIERIAQILSPTDNLAASELKIIKRDIKLKDISLEQQLESVLLLDAPKTDAEKTAQINWQSDNIGLNRSLEQLSSNLVQSLEHQSVGTAKAIEALVGASLTVTTGFLVWVLRGGALLASMFSINPLWAQLDPLPIAKSTDGASAASDDDEKVETMFEKK